jgi:hypothetical protein
MSRRGVTRSAALWVATTILAGSFGWHGVIAGAADDPGILEHRVKAAFLYKFASYVDWPASSSPRPGEPFTIAIVGSEPIADELSKMVTGRTLNDRPVVVKRLKAGESLTNVHILFIGERENMRLQSLVLNAQAQSILTVTESEGALNQGSVINFVVPERKVRFEISMESAERSKLKLSSRLLAVAQQVRMRAP